MGRSKHGKIDGQFVPLLHATLDSPAWRVMSHGARSLYAALKRRVPRERNVAWVSYRDAIAELKSSKRKIADWFRELQHYGFIRLHSAGHLGVDGKGQSPHWRLTELGKTPRASSDGLPESPTRDFLMWDGEVFKARANTKWNDGARLEQHRKKNPGSRVRTGVVPASATPPVPASDTPISESGSRVVDIGNEESGSRVVDISSLTTPGESAARPPASSQPLSEGSFEGENIIGPCDDRIIQLDKTTAERRKTRRAS